jgi:hypothetical protein
MADRILTVEQLLKELEKYNHNELHVHHTYSPNHYNWNNRPDPQYWQDSMRRFHTKTNGWADIAQHVTLCPDGRFITGRPFNQTPASIKGHNTMHGLPFMVEMIGNFDIGHDKFEGAQKDSMLKLAQWFDKRGKYIRFHRENAAKTCPGTSIDKAQFMADVRGKAQGGNNMILKVGCRGSDVLNLQKNLNGLGYDCGKADGIYGNGTKKSVQQFQKAQGLNADGIAGPKTLSAIQTALNSNKANAELYKVQVGAFSKKGNAEKLAQELKGKGYQTYIVKE